MNLLDIKNFRKVEVGDKHTILEHPSGHQIKIGHKGLSADARKQLEEMPTNLAKGGYAKFAQANDPNMKGAKAAKAAKSTNTMPGSPTDSSKSFTEPQEMGTSIPRDELQAEMTNGQQPDVVLSSLNKKAPPFGPLSSEPKQHYPPCINPSCKSYGKSHPNCRCYGGFHEAGHFAEGGEVDKEKFCDANRMHFKGCEYFKDGGAAGDNKLSEGEKLDLAKQEVAQEAPQGSNAPPPNLDIPETSAPDTQDAPPPQAQQPQAPSQPQSAPENYEQPPSDPFANYQKNISNNLALHAQNFQNDLDQGNVQPEHYFHLFGREGTLGKIGTAFGLMLGGIGSGLTHQPNAALEVMNNEINNDLKAQELSSQNRQSFLKINQNGLMNQAQMAALDTKTAAEAKALALSNTRRAALHHLVQTTLNMPEGPKKQQAMQTLAMMNDGIQKEDNDMFSKVGAAQALQQAIYGGQTPPGGQVNSEQQFQKQNSFMKSGAAGPLAQKVGEDRETKHYPGIPGLASAPLTNEDRDQIHSGMTFDKSLNNFRQWAKTHSGDLDPKDRAYGQSLAADVQGAYRQATHGGVYKEGEQNFISKVIDNTPTKFFNSIRVIPGLDAAADANKLRLDALLKDKGFQGYPGSEQTPSGNTSKSGKKIIYKNGKAYYE
jgi:hypothetical protein